MKKIRCSFSLILMWVFLCHANGLALYEALVKKIHENARVTMPESENDAVVLTFDKPKSTFYLHASVLPKHMDALKQAGAFEEVHPLTALFYIAWLQTEKIPFELVSEWESLSQAEKVFIVAHMNDFMNMVGDNDFERLGKMGTLIVQFIMETEDHLSLDKMKKLLKKEIISNATFHFLSRQVGDEFRAVKMKKKQNKHDDKITAEAQKIAQKVRKNSDAYSAQLFEKNMGGKSPKVTVETNWLKNPDAPSVWQKACTDYNNEHVDHHNAYKLEIQKESFSCAQCCSCFWCFFCCCPCMLIWACKNDCDCCSDGQELQFRYQ